MAAKNPPNTGASKTSAASKTSPTALKAAKDRRKSAPVKHVTLSAEARNAYAEKMHALDKRDQEHTQFLPGDLRGKR